MEDLQWTSRSAWGSPEVSAIEDFKGVVHRVQPGTKIKFWRPSNGATTAGNGGNVVRKVKGSKQWWYDGVIAGAYLVKFPSGKQKEVVEIN